MEACEDFDGNLFKRFKCAVCQLYIDLKHSIFYSVLYFNYIARNVSIVQNEKIHSSYSL